MISQDQDDGHKADGSRGSNEVKKSTVPLGEKVRLRNYLELINIFQYLSGFRFSSAMGPQFD